MTAEEYYKEAEAARRSGKMNDAAALYRKAAEKDHGNAQLKLGQCYLNGRGVNENKRVAFIWLKKAAEKGLPALTAASSSSVERGRRTLRITVSRGETASRWAWKFK